MGGASSMAQMASKVMEFGDLKVGATCIFTFHDSHQILMTIFFAVELALL